MPPPIKYRPQPTLILTIVVLAIVTATVVFWFIKKPPPVSESHRPPEEILLPVKKPPKVIDYNQLKKETQTKAMMRERKAELGVNQGIDIIAKPDESLKIGDTTVPMQEILDEIRLKQGDIIENNSNSDGTGNHLYQGVYGIYVVQPGDNIWNIHFRFLKGYFNRKGLSLSPLSDEPDIAGFSSGVGKVLKFSENIVYIYNLKQKKLDVNLNLILPLNKIIIYNMDQVLALLDQIEYSKVSHIQFDGETLWIPAGQ